MEQSLTATPVRYVLHRPDYGVKPVENGRDRFGIPASAYVVYTAFDFHSFVTRKNPEGTVAAFRLAAARDLAFARDATLVVKFMNASFAPERAAALLHALSSLPSVVTIGAKLQQGMSSDLISHADCVVSLHRAEGLGLLVADAMARRIPVVATDYSATTELLSTETGYPVRHRMIPVGQGDYPLSDGATWADPDIEDAADQLLRAFGQRSEGVGRAQRGKQHLTREFGESAVIDALGKKVADLKTRLSH